ncbi:hypothetical protein EQH66_11405 [Escherichia coli]|nr:hypothetical protein EQH66_11405 [Escherichia coli]
MSTTDHLKNFPTILGIVNNRKIVYELNTWFYSCDAMRFSLLLNWRILIFHLYLPGVTPMISGG